MSMKAHKSPDKHYLSKKINESSFIFSFPGSWTFQLFPSLKYTGLDETATCDEAFLKRSKAVLANQTLQK